MMLSLFRLEHLGQDYVFIYLIKIPLPALTKGTLSHQSVHPGFFPLNSKDYLCWLTIEVGWMGAMASMKSIGLSEYALVCCPPWLRARHHHHMPSGSETELFYLYSCIIIHLEVHENKITLSLWLSQPCSTKIYNTNSVKNDLCAPLWLTSPATDGPLGFNKSSGGCKILFQRQNILLFILNNCFLLSCHFVKCFPKRLCSWIFKKYLMFQCLVWSFSFEKCNVVKHCNLIELNFLKCHGFWNVFAFAVLLRSEYLSSWGFIQVLH